MHTLPNLSYSLDALEPYIDEATMQLHYSKHHQTYVDKLNAALASHPELQSKTAEELLAQIGSLPSELKTAVTNHAGGHANHTLFWSTLSPQKSSPSANFNSQLTSTFGSFEKFQELLTNTALNHFGSGWAWLVYTPNKKLELCSTPNQNSPLMDGKTPLMGIDVWEHAYYLKYQNKRPDYVKALWSIFDWPSIEERLGKL